MIPPNSENISVLDSEPCEETPQKADYNDDYRFLQTISSHGPSWQLRSIIPAIKGTSNFLRFRNLIKHLCSLSLDRKLIQFHLANLLFSFVEDEKYARVILEEIEEWCVSWGNIAKRVKNKKVQAIIVNKWPYLIQTL